MSTSNLDLVVIVDDTNGVPPKWLGCDQMTVVDTAARQRVFTGAYRVSPGRLAANSDLTTVLSINGTLDRPGDNFLALMQRSRPDVQDWVSQIVTGTTRESGGEDLVFTPWGDVVIAPDNDTFFASLGQNYRGHGTPSDGRVGRFRLSEIEHGQVGPLRGAMQLGGFAARLLLSPDGQQLHVLESGADGDAIRTFATSNLAETGSRVLMAPILPTVLIDGADRDNTEPGYIFLKHASLSTDGRLLATNRWTEHEANLVNLVARTSHRVPLPAELTNVGGLAFNRGWLNRGLLAIHGRDAVSVLRLDSGPRLTEIGRIRIRAPNLRAVSHSGPWPTVAWSASGDRLIAAASDTVTGSDFVVIDVQDGGRQLRIAYEIDACIVPADYRPPADNLSVSRPSSILTGNGIITSPRVAPTPTPTLAECVCPAVRALVPPVVIANALANPGAVFGWQQPLNPGLPPGPNNPLRTCLSLRNPSVTYYHPVFNPVIFQVGCP